MNIRHSLTLALLPFLVACNQAGEPCEYTELETTGTVQTVADEKAVVLLAALGNTHIIDEVRFPELPKPGQQYHFIVQTIAKGSCAPYAYRVVKRLP
ncbi:MAG: hypothetical protein H6943_10110 [Zoogloeaceae bacterium]|nr:hypothetical protein [Zoogloeaceae bacterium]